MKFIAVETPDGTYKVGMDEVPFTARRGSWNILQARVLGITYPQYLKYCMSYGGQLRGRTGYSYCVFKDKGICNMICKKLNEEWSKFNITIEKEN